jgi:hypothetical protein
MNDDTPTPPNLDLIQMVQRARLLHDADARPSEVSGVYWLEHKPAVTVRPPTPRAGLWVIHTDAEHLDPLWERLKAANTHGALGYKIKASTAPRGQDAAPTARVIMVCVADGSDAADVERVRQALLSLGIDAAVLHWESSDTP